MHQDARMTLTWNQSIIWVNNGRPTEKNVVMQAARNKAVTTTTKIIKGQRRGLNGAFSSLGVVEEDWVDEGLPGSAAADCAVDPVAGVAASRRWERGALSFLLISRRYGLGHKPTCDETVKLLWRDASHSCGPPNRPSCHGHRRR